MGARTRSHAASEERYQGRRDTKGDLLPRGIHPWSRPRPLRPFRRGPDHRGMTAAVPWRIFP